MELENIITKEEAKIQARPESRIKRLTKNIGKKLAVASLTTALTLGAAELIFREYEKHSSSVLFMDEITKDKIGPFDLERFKDKPHAIVLESKCNSLGYFDEQEFIMAKKSGVKRVVAIADSFGVRYTPIKYHAFTKAENLEGKFGNPKWELYNLSRCNTNPEIYLYILREYSLKYNPDLTLIGFFCGNDLRVGEMLGFYNKAVANFKKKEPLSEKIRTLKVIKRLYRLYKAGYLGKKGKTAIAKNDSELEKLIDVHSEEWWKDINNESPAEPKKIYMDNATRYFTRNMFSIEHQNYVRLREIFSEMKKLTQNKLAVVLFPIGCQIDDDLYKKVMLNSKYLEEVIKKEFINLEDEQIKNVNRDRVYKNVKNILEEQNIPIIELLEPLKQGQKKYGRVYYLQDSHLNYWGNHIAAGEIRKYMRDYFSQEKEK